MKWSRGSTLGSAFLAVSAHLGGLRLVLFALPLVSPVRICHNTHPKPYTSTAAVPALTNTLVSDIPICEYPGLHNCLSSWQVLAEVRAFTCPCVAGLASVATVAGAPYPLVKVLLALPPAPAALAP